MASKKKRNRPRPPSGSKPAAKSPGQPKASGQGKAGGGAKAGTKPPRERTGPTRAERLAAAETARRRRATRNRALVAGGIVAVLAVITFTVVNSRRSESRVISALEASGACNYDTRADTDSGQGRNHVTGDIDYEVDPPSGGNHNPAAARPGTYTLENKPPDGEIVHAHEHGYVTLWHRPDADAGVVGQLRDLAGRYDRDVLLVERELPPSESIAATAWNRRLICSRVDVAALERFITEFRNEGPEDVPH